MKVVGGILLAAVAALGIVFFTYTGMYTAQINGDEAVTQRMGNMKAEEKRRYDLIPNLVATVEAAGIQEKSILVEVTKARAEATKTVINVSAADLVNDPAKMRAAQDALTSMQSALSRLLVASENYPSLKSNENYLTLMKQLEGTENRIKTARFDYNQAVRVNNVNVRGFWGSMVAGRTGVKVRETFDIPDVQREAPVVKFNQPKT